MNSFSSRFLFGGLIVFIGVLLLLDQFGIGTNLTRLWPLIIVIFGLYMIIRNPYHYLPGFFVLFIGIILQLNTLNIFSFSVWNLWPLFIIFIGVSTLLGRKSYSTTNQTQDDFIKSDAVFWAREEIVKGKFKGASVNAVFGGIKLDLRDAQIEGKAVIDVNLCFGGVEIYIPENVKVINKGMGVVGGFSDKSRVSNSSSDKIIEITGNAFFGGVEIK